MVEKIKSVEYRRRDKLKCRLIINEIFWLN